MYDVIQCEDRMPASRYTFYGARSFLCSCSFCYLILVGVILCLPTGCVAKPTYAAFVATAQMQSEPSLLLPNDLPAEAMRVPLLALIPPLTSTGTVTDSSTLSASVNAASAVEAPTTLLDENTITYTVKPGDNLSKIATLHGTTVEKIVALNGLTSDIIHSGDVLTIPNTGVAPPVPPISAPTPTATLTETTQSTDTQTAVNQPTPEGETGTGLQSVWRLITSIIDEYRGLVLSITLPATLLVGVLVFFLFRRGSPARVPSTQPLSLIAAPSSSGLSGPPTAGAYLETQPDATGVTLYYPLAQPITSIGRDRSNTIFIDRRFAQRSTVSRRHVEIMRTGDLFIAKDLESANGLWINGRRSRENVLHEGVVLGIGKTQFIFRHNQPGGIA